MLAQVIWLDAQMGHAELWLLNAHKQAPLAHNLSHLDVTVVHVLLMRKVVLTSWAAQFLHHKDVKKLDIV